MQDSSLMDSLNTFSEDQNNTAGQFESTVGMMMNETITEMHDEYNASDSNSRLNEKQKTTTEVKPPLNKGKEISRLSRR